MGMYVHSAVGAAVEHCIFGRRAKSKYIEKPLLEELEEKNKPLTEDEIQRRREKFIAKMKALEVNFKAAKVAKEAEKDNV